MNDLDPEERAVRQANQFMNDNDRPSPEYLRGLVQAGTVQASELLHELADRYNVVYDQSTTAQELADKISLRMEQEADNETLS